MPDFSIFSDANETARTDRAGEKKSLLAQDNGPNTKMEEVKGEDGDTQRGDQKEKSFACLSLVGKIERASQMAAEIDQKRK